MNLSAPPRLRGEKTFSRLLRVVAVGVVDGRNDVRADTGQRLIAHQVRENWDRRFGAGACDRGKTVGQFLANRLSPLVGRILGEGTDGVKKSCPTFPPLPRVFGLEAQG